MSEAIDRVTVFQDAADTWWLEFYADAIRHQVTIEDVLNGLASFVNMQATNAVLHEKANDSAAELAALQSALAEARPLVAVLAEMKGKDWTKFQYWNFHPVGEDNVDAAAAWMEKHG